MRCRMYCGRTTLQGSRRTRLTVRSGRRRSTICFVRVVRGSSPRLTAAAWSRDILMGRVGTVDDIAALICFLVGPDAGYITAATYDINGGLQIS